MEVSSMVTNVQIFAPDGTVKTLTVDEDKKIIAAHQNIRRIPRALAECYGQWVEVLDLSHNKLRDVRQLRGMTRLQTLILDHNLIVSTTMFPKLPTLQVLWINFNLISDVLLFIPALGRACPNLRHLSLMGNIASISTVTGSSEQEQEHYRNFVIGHFDQLLHLDEKPVSTIERVRNEKKELTLKEKILLEIFDFRSACEFKINRTFSSVV